MKNCSVGEGYKCSDKITKSGYCTKHDIQVKKTGRIYRTLRDPRPVVDMGEYLKIPLGVGVDIQYALVDKKDSHVAGFTWYLGKNGYAARRKPFVYMHRLIMRPDVGMTVDHVNGDTLDNRRRNLRVCSFSENCFNKKVASNNTSGATGVYPYKYGKNKFVSYIGHKNTIKYLGIFDSKEEAKTAYEYAAKKLFGKFRRAI